MSIIIGTVALCVAVLASFADKIIEHFSPEGKLAKMESEADEVMLHIDEEDFVHHV